VNAHYNHIRGSFLFHFFPTFTRLHQPLTATRCGIRLAYMTEFAPKHPREILFDQVKTTIGVKRNKLARDIDVPASRISDAVAGKQGVSLDIPMRCSEYFGTTAELWLRLQADDNFYVARTTSWQAAAPMVFRCSNLLIGNRPRGRLDRTSVSPL